MIFIYGLIDPITNELRYVGKSVNPKARLSKHIREAKLSTSLHRYAWIRGLMNIGLAPKLILLMQVRDSDWQDTERLLISSLRDSGYNLTNMADGGLGGATGRGKKRTKIWVKKISEANRQRYIDNPDLLEVARQRTKEIWEREGFRDRQSIILNSPEVKAKTSKSQKERWNNPIIRQKQSEVGKRNWQNPELAQQMKDKITQKWKDPEYKARLRLSQLRRWTIKRGEIVE